MGKLLTICCQQEANICVLYGFLCCISGKSPSAAGSFGTSQGQAFLNCPFCNKTTFLNYPYQDYLADFPLVGECKSFNLELDSHLVEHFLTKMLL